MTEYERAMWTGLNRAMAEDGNRIEAGYAGFAIFREGDEVVFSSNLVPTDRVPYWCDGNPVHRAARVRQYKRMEEAWSAYRQKIATQLAADIAELDRKIALRKHQQAFKETKP